MTKNTYQVFFVRALAFIFQGLQLFIKSGLRRATPRSCRHIRVLW